MSIRGVLVRVGTALAGRANAQACGQRRTGNAIDPEAWTTRQRGERTSWMDDGAGRSGIISPRFGYLTKRRPMVDGTGSRFPRCQRRGTDVGIVASLRHTE